MSDLEDRLIKCFSAVFPGMDTEEIKVAHEGALGVWDSLTAVTLVAVVQQEFGIDIGVSDMAGLDSFVAFEDYLRRHEPQQPGGSR